VDKLSGLYFAVHYYCCQWLKIGKQKEIQTLKTNINEIGNLDLETDLLHKKNVWNPKLILTG